MTTADEGPGRCDYCRLPLPAEPQVETHQGVEYTFCSRACAAASRTADRVFTQHHGSRRFDTGVQAIDAVLPDGMPRNAFVLLADEAGTRTEALQVELAYRMLERDEPVIVVSFLEPPISILQGFVNADRNPIPPLESGQLHILDCFTNRLGDQGSFSDALQGWNRHLQTVASEHTTAVHDPEEPAQVHARLEDALDELDMQEQGLVLLDSLTELGAMVQPVKAYGFVRDLRADVCKARFVPIIAGATIVNGEGEFPHDLAYMVDGLVDVRLNPNRMEDTLVKELRVRKLNGVRSVPTWLPYEVTDAGVVPIELPEDDGGESDTEAEDEPSADARAAEERG